MTNSFNGVFFEPYILKSLQYVMKSSTMRGKYKSGKYKSNIYLGYVKKVRLHMIDKDSFNILNYVKMEEYSGSMDGMRYMLKAVTIDDEKKMKVTVWPEPYGIAHTPEDLKMSEIFPLSKEGVDEAADYLNSQYVNNKQLWEISKM